MQNTGLTEYLRLVDLDFAEFLERKRRQNDMEVGSVKYQTLQITGLRAEERGYYNL